MHRKYCIHQVCALMVATPFSSIADDAPGVESPPESARAAKSPVLKNEMKDDIGHGNRANELKQMGAEPDRGIVRLVRTLAVLGL